MEKQNLLYTISVYSEDTVLTDHTERTEKSYFVGPEELMTFFSPEEVVLKPEPGLVWMASGKNGERYMHTFPASKKPFTLFYHTPKDGLRSFRMRLPEMAVMSAVVRTAVASRSVRSISCWLYGGELKDTTTLFAPPLPNFTKSVMCIGQTDGTVENTVGETAYRMVTESIYNTHHDSVGSEQLPFEKFAKKYRGRMPFDRLESIGFGRDILNPKCSGGASWL